MSWNRGLNHGKARGRGRRVRGARQERAISNPTHRVILGIRKPLVGGQAESFPRGDDHERQRHGAESDEAREHEGWLRVQGAAKCHPTPRSQPDARKGHGLGRITKI